LAPSCVNTAVSLLMREEACYRHGRTEPRFGFAWQCELPSELPSEEKIYLQARSKTGERVEDELWYDELTSKYKYAFIKLVMRRLW
jgi:hypothetical protein